MAAVAAEPGAAAVSTTVGDRTELESEAKLQTEATNECTSVMDLVHLHKDRDAAPECRLVNAEAQDRPELEAAVKASTEDEQIDAGYPEGGEKEVEITPKDHGWTDIQGECGSFKAEFSPVLLEAVNEISPYDSIARFQPAPTPSYTSKPSVVFLHSHHSPPALRMESGLAAPLLSSIEPMESKTQYATHHPDATEPTEIVCEVRALIKPLLVTEPEPESVDVDDDNDDDDDDAAASAEFETDSTEDAVLKCCETADHIPPLSVLENEKLGTADEKSNTRDLINIFPSNSFEPPVTAVDQVPEVLESEDLHAPRRMLNADSGETRSESKPSVPGTETTTQEPDSLSHLSPGSEVRVSLDHIIDDALVVSFQLGEKIFSGVLMDLSKRFGPYGIPVTVFPRREYRDRPESMQLKTEPLPLDVEKDEGGEGAPYPPPLFIRDTYSQSIPQPPPRKIKRPKRRLYREEPTSIMSAIRLRPRQVLCDKCKGAVATGDKREARRGPGSDFPAGRGEEAKRRRGRERSGRGQTAPARGKGPRH
ncbi:hypothetical protein AAFF_G00247050 [Aldrovandia affinis]|uniref:Uncharacterized protein n=1 Tax=Aldrovandia affinis TaxID=143900 RepID=A0AAD7SU66_9TELE|nr:hypothetical protein AAFF_G00247050 [Aldrovandia affinis]